MVGTGPRHDIADTNPIQMPSPRVPMPPCPRAPSRLGRAGRDVIAITSVGGRSWEWSDSLPDSAYLPLRTAAMAMAALPKTSGHKKGPQVMRSF